MEAAKSGNIASPSACAVYRLSKASYLFLFEDVWGTMIEAIKWPSDVDHVCSTPTQGPSDPESARACHHGHRPRRVSSRQPRRGAGESQLPLEGIRNTSERQIPDQRIGNLGLSDDEENEIVEFMETLSDGYFPVSRLTCTTVPRPTPPSGAAFCNFAAAAFFGFRHSSQHFPGCHRPRNGVERRCVKLPHAAGAVAPYCPRRECSLNRMR